MTNFFRPLELGPKVLYKVKLRPFVFLASCALMLLKAGTKITRVCCCCSSMELMKSCLAQQHHIRTVLTMHHAFKKLKITQTTTGALKTRVIASHFTPKRARQAEGIALIL